MLIPGSPSRRSISVIHWSFGVPGSTRQSRAASAIDGMTLTFGGSPTPERRRRERDRRVLDRVVELVVGQRANARLERFEHAELRRRHGLAEEPRQRPDEPVVGVLVVRLRAVPGDAFGGELQPDRVFSPPPRCRRPACRARRNRGCRSRLRRGCTRGRAPGSASRASTPRPARRPPPRRAPPSAGCRGRAGRSAASAA